LVAWVDFGRSVRMPSSILQGISVPLLIVVALFLAMFTSFIALLLVSPAIVLWLVTYMLALWLVAPRIERRVARVVVIALSGGLWLVLLRGNDRLVVYAMLAVGIVYGCIVRLPSRNRGHLGATTS
jgi:hypothetical protein